MRLAEYLAASNLSDAEFADRVGVHKSTVGRWVAGAVRPAWDQLPKITAATDGQVTANDFVDDQGPAPVARKVA